MKNLLRYLLALSLALAPINLHAGWLPLVKAGGGGGSPVVSFVARVAGTPSGSTVTATINGGNPSYILTRRIILVLDGTWAGATITSGTINGVSVDQFTATPGCNFTDCVDFVSAPVPSGTTGLNVALNYTGSPTGTPSISVYNVDNSLLSSITPIVAATEVSNGSGVNTTTVNTTTKAGGFILAGLWCGGGAGPSITASTETYTSDYTNAADFTAHANSITSNASNSVSTQCPPAGGNSLLALAAWR